MGFGVDAGSRNAGRSISFARELKSLEVLGHDVARQAGKHHCPGANAGVDEGSCKKFKGSTSHDSVTLLTEGETRSAASNDSSDMSDLSLGRWTPSGPDPFKGIPLDIIFPIPTKADLAMAPDFIKQDGQKADNAEVPKHLWSFFFEQSFMHNFGSSSTVKVSWVQRHSNVYRRHDWHRCESMPEDWEKAMDSFRRLGIRWWRRNLMRTFRRWRERAHLLPGRCSCMVAPLLTPEGYHICPDTNGRRRVAG